MDTTSRQVLQKILRINGRLTAARLLGLVCLLMGAGLLTAGLWPFRSPRNQVTWIAGGSGVHFGRHATLLSSGEFKATSGQRNAPCSIEIWFRPDLADSGTLLALYTRGRQRQFWLHQSGTFLSLRTDPHDGIYGTASTRLYVDHVFHKGEPKFVTIVSGGETTSVYIDGVLVRKTSDFLLSGEDLLGELIVGNSFGGDDSWSGELRGLALYLQSLTPAQVDEHFARWSTKGRPAISEGEHPIALYLFDEHAGTVVRNQVTSQPDLYIPYHFTVVDQTFLQPFWTEIRPTWGCLQDVLVNIGGFVPFGLVCCAYLSLAGRLKRPGVMTTLIGFAISLTIEVLQAFLPTRGSGTLDLITNTLGTGCGVWLYRFCLRRAGFLEIWSELREMTERQES